MENKNRGTQKRSYNACICFIVDVFLQVRLSTQAYAPPTETNLVRSRLYETSDILVGGLRE